jgi:hypothetical protein
MNKVPMVTTNKFIGLQFVLGAVSSVLMFLAVRNPWIAMGTWFLVDVAFFIGVLTSMKVYYDADSETNERKNWYVS